MITFQQFITEGRDAPLYHGTRSLNALRIMKDGRIIPNTLHQLRDNNHKFIKDFDEFPKNTQGVSLTRSAEFATYWVIDWYGQNNGVVFELDQRLLSQRYQFKPTAFAQQWKTDGIDTRKREPVGVKASGANEYEEFLLTTKPLNLRPYLKRILLIGNVFEYLKSSPSAPSDWYDVMKDWEHFMYHYSYAAKKVDGKFILPARPTYDTE